ncbi:MAG TPA: hypothetical protein VIV15_11835 [Anaerolineales bacterium]
MKTTHKLLAGFLLLMLMLTPVLPAYAQGLADVSPGVPHGGKIIFGDDYVLHSGETLSGDLVMFGGNVTLESGSTVTGSMAVIGGNASAEADAVITGDLVMMGGNLSLLGKLNGNMVLVGGNASLGEVSVVGGDVTTMGGSLQRAPGAQVLGQVLDKTTAPSITIPSVGSLPAAPPDAPVPSVVLPGKNLPFNPLPGFLGTLGWSIAVSLIAVVASLFLQPQMERVSTAVISQPVLTGGFGLLALAGSLVALAIMAVTIILIPVSGLGLVILMLAWLFGLAALGQEVGNRLARQFNRSWALPLSAGIGTLLLMLVVGFLTSLVSCVGVLAAVLVGLTGLGGVVLTRFGSRNYPEPALLPVEMPPAS